MLNDRSSALSLLRTRRSARPRDLVEPGPNGEELRQILEIAVRSPDHGKLTPWRFIHVPKHKRDDFHQVLRRAYSQANPAAGRLELEAVERFAFQGPELIVALSCPVPSSKIPSWEQELSCGAALMNLLHGAHALGFAAGWVTGWAAFSESVRAAFATGEHDRVAGFIYIGTPVQPLEERSRPDLSVVTSQWQGG
jgi:nitroreductase